MKLAGANITAQTGAEGSFILPDVRDGMATVEIDGETVLTSQPFPKISLKKIVTANCDNQFSRPISLQQATGASFVVGASSLSEETMSIPAPSDADGMAGPAAQPGTATLQLPPGATFVFPGGATSGTLTLTMVDNSRTPVNLPLGVFSSAIAQITPFGATIAPGGKLTFPNPDGLPAGSPGFKLFRLEQKVMLANGQPNPNLGSFTEAGAAIVTASGIETAADAVKEGGYYFVATSQPTTTVIGRVVDSNGTTPVRLAVVRARGQEGFTDGNGGFILRFVPVKAAGDRLAAEASFVRPSGPIDRAQRDNIAAAVNAITTVTPDLVLPSETNNRPPIIVASADLIINAGEVLSFNFIAYDPDAGQTLLIWERKDFSFVASGTTATLWFRSLSSAGNSYGALIDNVRVYLDVP